MKFGGFLLADVKWPKGTRTQSFGFLLQVLARRLDGELKERLSQIEIDFRFFPTLMLLLSKTHRSQRDLCVELGLPDYQVSRNLDAMEKLGWVERSADPDSRRTTLVSLTEDGKKVAMQLPPLIRNTNEDFLHDLTDEEREVLVGLMQRVLQSQTPK